MIFRILGCSGSESDRNHPCSFIIDETTIVDMGSAASRLTIAEQANVKDIFLSHAHLDHSKDLAFFAENVINLVKHSVTVRGSEDTIKKLHNNILNDQIWPDFTMLPSADRSTLQFQSFESEKAFRVGEMEIYSIPVNHPGGCQALFFRSSTGSILYSGDTGPTDKLWEEVNRRGKELRAILLECSFPNQHQSLADMSGHHTPNTFQKEIAKITNEDVPIYAYHVKAPYREETVSELDRLEDARVRVLEPGMCISF